MSSRIALLYYFRVLLRKVKTTEDAYADIKKGIGQQIYSFLYTSLHSFRDLLYIMIL